MNNFITGLHNAILLNKTTYTWPSGLEVGITSIKLNSLKNLSVPTQSTDKVERESNLWRIERFPNLYYSIPKVQATTVDIIINDIRIQDKHGHKPHDHIGYTVGLTKNGGRQKKKSPLRSNYEVGDFDALFVFLNDTRKYIFVIPSYVLEEKGILKTKECPGKTVITCYKPDYKHKAGRYADKWTQEYCIDTDKSDAEERIINILMKCKNNS